MEHTIPTESQLLHGFSSFWNELPHSIQKHVQENTNNVARIILGIIPINALGNRIHDLTSDSNIRLKNTYFIQGFYSIVMSGVDEKELFEKIKEIMKSPSETGNM